MELPEFKRKYIIKNKIIGLPPDIIRLLFSYLSGTDIENLFKIYPKLKNQYSNEYKAKIFVANSRMNYPKNYKINTYIIEGENKDKYDKFIEKVYNGKYFININSWKSFILRTYDETGLNKK